MTHLPQPSTHILGNLGIGADQKLEFAQEAYGQGKISQEELLTCAEAIETSNWQAQRDADLSLLTVGDFVLYDSILTHAVRLGVFPARFAKTVKDQQLNMLDRQYYLAHGCTQHGLQGYPVVTALETANWFNTSCHYYVPELTRDQTFTPDFSDLLAQIERAKQYGLPIKVVVTGLLTFLYQSRLTANTQITHHEEPIHDETDDHTKQAQHGQNDLLKLVDKLLPAYATLFDQLRDAGVAHVQVDEPILVLNLPRQWRAAFESVYHRLQRRDLSIILATYFGTLGENLNLACHLPIAGLHIDVACEQPSQRFWQQVIDQLPTHKILSLGLIDGRSTLPSDLDTLQSIVNNARSRLGDRLWLASGCSLLHVLVDQAKENVPAHIGDKRAFARQKLNELSTLAKGQSMSKVLHSTEYVA